MTLKRFLSTVTALLLSVTTILADNWPQWRGPGLNGVSNEKNLPTRWGTVENVAWRLALPGRSASTPIIWGDRVFLSVPEGETIYLWCVDKKQGNLLWKKPLRGRGSEMYSHPKHNASTPSPVTDGKSVYALNALGSLHAFDFAGREIWVRELQKDYGPFGLREGYASSSLLYEGSLYIQVLRALNGPSYLLKIAGQTGKTLWKVEFATGGFKPADSYATPTILRYDRGAELVINGTDMITGHDLSSGQELWRVRGLSAQSPPARTAGSAVVANGVVYSSGLAVPSTGRPLIALRAGGRGDITESHRLWSVANGPDIPTPVTDGKYFYAVNDKGIVRCLNAKTGQTVWGPTRLKPGDYTASPVLADGKIYVINEDGLTSIIKTGPTFEVLAENELNDLCLSSPAVSEGQIFIRTAKYLYCIGKRAGA